MSDTDESQARIEITNDPGDPIRMYTSNGLLAFDREGWHESLIHAPCGAAAPVVANGAAFIGCTLARHPWPEVKHEVRITW